MPIFAFIRLLVRLFATAGSLKDQYKEESERFDEKHNISAPNSKTASHLVVGVKVFLFSLIMGDFDFLGGFSPNKYLTLSALVFIVVFMFFFIIIIMSPCEKDGQRYNAINKEYKKFRKEEKSKVLYRRAKRKKSKYIHDFGF